MLDHILAPLLSNTTQPRVLTRLDNYLTTLHIRQKNMIARSTNLPGAASSGVRVMTQIIDDADIDNLNRSWANDSDRWQYSLADRLSTLERLFTPITNGLSTTPLFVDRALRCAEFLIPVRPRDSVVRLLQTAQWNDWQSYRPFHIVDIDSNELTFETHADRIRFVRNPPTRIVYTLDVAGLVLQYASYVREHDVNDARTLSLTDYLHKYVITESLVEDLTTLWILRKYTVILRNIETNIDMRDLIDNSERHGIYGQVGQSVAIAMQDVRNLAIDVRDGNLLPSMFLASLRLNPTTNAPQMCRLVYGVNEISDFRQERWVNFLRAYTWIEMIIHLYRLNPTTPSMRTLGVVLRRDIPLLISTRFWESVRHVPTRQWMERYIRYLFDIFATAQMRL